MFWVTYQFISQPYDTAYKNDIGDHTFQKF